MYLLRKYLYDNKQTYSYVAKCLGISSQYVHMIADGSISAIKNYKIRKKLCELLKIKEDDLDDELKHL